MIIDYKNTNFVGICKIHSDFKHKMDQVNEIAKKEEFFIIVTSSYRETNKVKGAIVKPATRSNHMIGHAIDFNLSKDKRYYNSIKLGDMKGEDNDFITKIVKETGLTWGGSFKTKDSVHLDDRLNVLNPKLWDKKFKEINNIK